MPFASFFSGKPAYSALSENETPPAGNVSAASDEKETSFIGEKPATHVDEKSWKPHLDIDRVTALRRQSDISLPSSYRDHSAVVAKSSRTIQVRSQAIGDTRVTRIKVSMRPYGPDNSELWAHAIPVHGWFRALLVLFHIVMGSTAIQVGLREENVVCEASFSTLMIIAGFLQLVQAAFGMYMVVYSVGFEGEELRLCLWMIELVAWTLVSHALLTDICGNRKIHATAILYLISSLIVWVITVVLWISAFIKTEDSEKRVEIKYVS